MTKPVFVNITDDTIRLIHGRQSRYIATSLAKVNAGMYGLSSVTNVVIDQSMFDDRSLYSQRLSKKDVSAVRLEHLLKMLPNMRAVTFAFDRNAVPADASYTLDMILHFVSVMTAMRSVNLCIQHIEPADRWTNRVLTETVADVFDLQEKLIELNLL